MLFGFESNELEKMVMLIMLTSTIESDNIVLQGKEDKGNRNANYLRYGQIVASSFTQMQIINRCGKLLKIVTFIVKMQLNRILLSTPSFYDFAEKQNVS